MTSALRERERAAREGIARERAAVSALNDALDLLVDRRGRLQRQLEVARARRAKREPVKAWLVVMRALFALPAMAFVGVVSGLCASLFVLIPSVAFESQFLERLGEGPVLVVPMLAGVLGLAGVLRAVVWLRRGNAVQP